MTIRRGSISGPGFKAVAYKGSNPVFRGRIAVVRGSGMTEFPSLTQLSRILREEGIAASAGEQAFGRGRLKANGGEDIVREGYMKIGDTEAEEYAGPEPKLVGKIHVSGPGIEVFKTYPEFQKLAEKFGIKTEDVLLAFGHLIRKAKLGGETGAVAARLYTQKHIKIGHLAHGGAKIARGTKKGSLVLIDSRDPSKAVWGVIEDPPKTIRNVHTNRVMSLEGVFTKAKALKIPPQAVYDAFGHLLTAAAKKELLKSFHQGGKGMSLVKNRRARRKR